VSVPFLEFTNSRVTNNHRTIIIRHVLEEQQKSQTKIGLAYLYCVHLDKGQSAVNFVGALLHQLVGQSEQVSLEVLSLYKDHMSGSSPTCPLLEGYEKALKLELRRFESVYVIVDALDECRNDDEDEFQPATRVRLLQTFRSLGDKIHLLFTSRDESPVAAPPTFETPIATMKVSATDDDIKSYVEGRIALNEPLKAHITEELAAKIQKTVVERAAGM
jgi:hypothetical protein